MNTHEELLPCPFCGGEAEIWRASADPKRPAWVGCMGRCAVLVSREYETTEEAIAAWNRRTPPAAVPDGWVLVPRDPTPEMLFAATSPESYWIGHTEAKPESIERWRQGHREDAARKYRSMISAAPAAPNGWQPIETAPKDGTDVLLWDGEEIFVGYWSDSIWVSPGAWVKEEHRSDTVTYIPTHWMPLPAAPTEATNKEGENG